MPLTPFFTPERIFLLYCLVGGFIIGQLQFSFFLSKLKKKDLRHHGTGDYGATNAFRVLGAPFGILTFLLDFGKTVLAIYIATKVLPMHPELAIDFHALVLYTGLGVVLGHIFPVYLKFRGGKGFSCTLATFLCLQDIKLTGIVILVFLIMFLISRYVSLSSMVTVFFGAISFMFFMLMRWTYVETDWIFDCQCALVLLFVFCLIAHRGNIVRLVFGDERKFYFRKKKRLEALEEDYTNFDKYFDEVEAEESGLASVEAALLSDEADLDAEGLDEMTEAAEEAAEEAEEAAEEVVEETAEETIEAEAEAAQETAENAEEAEETVEEAAETVEEEVEEATEAVEEIAEETAETTEEAAEAVEETVEETAKETAEVVEETAEETAEAVEETIEETAETTEETAEEITESAEEIIEETVEESEKTAEETVEEVSEEAEEMADQAVVEETEEEAAEENTEEVAEAVEEAAEDITESAEEISETAEEAVEESAEETAEAAEETEETVEKAAAAAIPLAGFFGRIKSLFRKPEEADELNTAESIEPVSEEIQETVEETDATIEDHLKTKFKDFDITKKIGLSLGGEEENPEDVTQSDNVEESPENETANVDAGGVFAAGFFGRMKDKLQKAIHPQEKEIPGFLSDDMSHTEEVVNDAVETAAEAVEEATEEFPETVEDAEEEISDVVEESAEETAEAVEETAVDVEETAEEITENVEDTVEEAAEITGGVVLPGFFARMKAKVLRSVNLDEWKEDAQEASEEIENAADEVFGNEDTTNEIQAFEGAEEAAESVEEFDENPSEELIEEPAQEVIEEVSEKAPSKLTGFLNKVRSILPNHGEEQQESFEEEPAGISETADDALEAATETAQMTEEEAQQLEEAGEEFFDSVTGDLAETEEAIDDIAVEPKVGFFGKIRNKFRNFDISQKIGLSLNTEEQAEPQEDLKDSASEKVEDLKDTLEDKIEDFKESVEEKVEDIKDSAQEKVEDFKDSVEDKVNEVKETVEEKAEDIKEDIEIKEAETKAEIELQTEKIAQDLKEATEEISDDLKKKI
ncbi:MAG: glycerol-3-phosphate acyltransferase [Lachnospiraceae bacterium]|nr:glycerol-3-phosphate acyltransferase [Lachnospiraceae bacterium]